MRFYYIVTILVGILLLLNIAGFETPISGSILGASGLIDENNNMSLQESKNSDLFGGDTQGVPGLAYIFTIFAGAGLVLGAFGRSPDIRYTTALFVWAFVGYLSSDIIWLFNKIKLFDLVWLQLIMGILLSVTMIALWISAISYWQGSDG